MAASPEELTPEETALLKEHLWFYTALAERRRKPTTPAQEHFVAVCHGAATSETAHEVAFLKFRNQQNAEWQKVALKRQAEERQAALKHQEEYQRKLNDYWARRNRSLMESDEDRWW